MDSMDLDLPVPVTPCYDGNHYFVPIIRGRERVGYACANFGCNAVLYDDAENAAVDVTETGALIQRPREQYHRKDQRF